MGYRLSMKELTMLDEHVLEHVVNQPMKSLTAETDDGTKVYYTRVNLCSDDHLSTRDAILRVCPRTKVPVIYIEGCEKAILAPWEPPAPIPYTPKPVPRDPWSEYVDASGEEVVEEHLAIVLYWANVANRVFVGEENNTEFYIIHGPASDPYYLPIYIEANKQTGEAFAYGVGVERISMSDSREGRH